MRAPPGTAARPDGPRAAIRPPSTTTVWSRRTSGRSIVTTFAWTNAVARADGTSGDPPGAGAAARPAPSDASAESPRRRRSADEALFRFLIAKQYVEPSSEFPSGSPCLLPGGSDESCDPDPVDEARQQRRQEAQASEEIGEGEHGARSKEVAEKEEAGEEGQKIALDGVRGAA